MSRSVLRGPGGGPRNAQKSELIVTGTSIAEGGGMTRQPENQQRPSVPAEKPTHLRVRSGLKAGLAIDGECKESNHNKGG